MDPQTKRSSLPPDSAATSIISRQQSVRPKNWQRNQRKFVKQNGVKNGGPGRIEKPKRNSWKDFDTSLLSNIPENTLIDSFMEKREKELLDLSQDFRNNGVVTSGILPFKPMDQSQFNHTYPKPVGWGRNQVNLGKTVNLDNGVSLDYKNYNELNCLGILHSKMDPVKRPECAFCKRNNAKDFYHLLKDELGGVVCPVLSAFTCKMCAATGRNAHTHKYCPVNPITKGDPVAAGMPPGRPLTKADKEWLKYFHTKFLLQLLEGNRIAR